VSTTATPNQAQSLDPRRWWTLLVLCLSLVIVFVGNSSLNVAIPTLSEHLHASNSQLQWVVASYSLVVAGLLFPSGALGDRFGRKGALQLGLLIFLIGAVLAAISTSINQLIACRALMGAAAAFIMPSTLSIIVNVFPPNERTKAIAFWAASSGGAGALGPVTSGLLLAHFWYGAVFLVNVPIIAFALVGGRYLVPRSRNPEETPLDPIGSVLSTVGLAGLVYGLIQAPERGWASHVTLGAFAISLVVLVLFVAWELQADAPMLDMHLFRTAAFSAGSAGMVLIFLAMYGVMFLITQYFQLVLGYAPLGAALRFLPMSPIMVVVATRTPRLAARFGAHRTVAAGMTLVAIGLLMFRGLELDTSYVHILGSIVPLTTGIALSMSPMTASIMSAVPPRRAGTGSAMNDATREIGAALGVAVLGSLAASRYSDSVNHALDSVPAASRASARSSLAGAIEAANKLHQPAGGVVRLAAQHAFVAGIHFAVTIAACLAALAVLVVLRFLPHQTSHETSVEAAQHRSDLGAPGVPSSAHGPRRTEVSHCRPS
jgi:EmrB/QacA subfamily drug resistance transporter